MGYSLPVPVTLLPHFPLSPLLSSPVPSLSRPLSPLAHPRPILQLAPFSLAPLTALELLDALANVLSAP